MFIARSTARVRLARTAFVLAGLVPCAALVAWAAHLRSARHREDVRRGWEAAVGLPLAIDAVEHPRPGVTRVRGCTVAAADGSPVLTIDTLEVEEAAAEVRLRTGRIACDPAAAALLAGVAGEWLARGPRFRRDVVVEAAAVEGTAPAGRADDRAPPRPMRIECVAQGTSRAVRVVRPAGADAVDECRVVRTVGDDGGGERVEVEAAWREPVPVPILAAVAGGTPVGGLWLGPAAHAVGEVAAVLDAGRWQGSAAGRVEGIDLAVCSTRAPVQAAGAATIDVRRIAWDDGGLVDGEFECRVGAGAVEQRFLDALVTTVGCRAGEAYGGPAAARERPFDAAGCIVRVGPEGVRLEGDSRIGGALAVVGDRPLVEPPAGPVPVDRLAWLVAPPGAVYVPSGGPGSWLMSILPGGPRQPRAPTRAGQLPEGREF